MPEYYDFGIEIEIISNPHKIRDPLLPGVYYELFAAALRNRGLKARADDPSRPYRKNPDQYEKGWWITRDGSLGSPSPPRIPLEAVSPILCTRKDWENEIDRFWSAHGAVFHMPHRSPLCGSHIHVSPESDRKWSTKQLRNIALGLVYYENYIHKMLPASRRDNSYCQRNSQSSGSLRHAHTSSTWWQDFHAAISMAGRAQIVTLMQSDRKVLWNFEHIVEGGLGTIEFRGGRGLRGTVRTKRWIAFAVAYLDFLVRMEMLTNNHSPVVISPESLYEKIRKSAERLEIGQHLPGNLQILNESSSRDDASDGFVELDDCSSTVSWYLQLTVRCLQFVLAISVAGLYGVDLSRARKPDHFVASKWVFAEVLATWSAVTCLVYCVPVMRACWGWFWNWLLFIFWTTAFGIFAHIYLGTEINDQDRMKHAVWLDLLNMFLWFITAVHSTVTFWRYQRAKYSSEV